MRKRFRGSKFVGSITSVIHTDDGVDIAATEYRSADAPRATLLIHSATAVPQTFYARFASHLAERGIRVITYDYRGIGGSRPASLRGFHATMSDWALHDARAALQHARKIASREPLFMLGHSFGGQLLALHDELHEVAGAVLVGAQFGWVGHWPWTRRALLSLWYKAVVPVSSALLGYVPGWTGLGEDLPAGVAIEWSTWCQHRDYLAGYVEGARERLARFAKPVLAFSFTDDAFAPKAAADHFHGLLTRANVHHLTLLPREVGVESVGHFGFFRPSAGPALWSPVLAFIDRVLSGPEQRANVVDLTPRVVA